MKLQLGRYIPQPLIGIVASSLALATLLIAWRGASSLELSVLGIAGFLVVGSILADQFPIHIRNNTKVYVSTIPLFLMAVLLQPHFAGLTTGVSVLTGEILGRTKRRSSWSTIATAVGRWTIIGWGGSMIAHLPLLMPNAHLLLLPATAVTMFAGDIVSVSIEIMPVSHEPLWHVLADTAREAVVLESVQYLIAILSAMAALEELWALVLIAVPMAVAYWAFKNWKEMQDGTRQLLINLADEVDQREPYTGGHSRRVAEYCADLLGALSITGPEAEMILIAARVHDIGKIAVPHHILVKSGRLTAEERAIMETHVKHGMKLLAAHHDFARGALMVMHHHEHWDGNGYPSGLKGYAIPLGARVIAVADSYDAMMTDRPYRRAMPVNQVAQIFREGRGKQWDPTIVDALFRVRPGLVEQSEPFVPQLPGLRPIEVPA